MCVRFQEISRIIEDTRRSARYVLGAEEIQSWMSEEGVLSLALEGGSGESDIRRAGMGRRVNWIGEGVETYQKCCRFKLQLVIDGGMKNLRLTRNR